MEEYHKNEQYFFNQATLENLESLTNEFENICCLCAPSFGKHLIEKDRQCATLDIDKRFETLEGFQYFDLSKAKWTDQQYDLIVCDPPFFNVSLRQLLQAIRVLSNYNPQQKLLICYLERRSRTFLEVFKEFGLEQTELYAGYQSVQPIEKNKIVFFGNLSAKEE